MESMPWWGVALLGGAAVLALAAVWTDVKRREIPHWLLAALASFWLCAALAAPEALGGRPLAGLACGAVALVVGFVLHALGWLGGGDGKLLAVLAMWLGPADMGLALLATSALGLLLAVPTLVHRAGDWRRRGIPYGLAISPPAATLLVARAVS